MTEENIYEMLGKAGMHVSNDVNHIGRVWCSDGYPIDEELFRFANLVAAHERERLVQVSPLEFVTAVLEKEHLVGKPLMWAQWPNEEKNT